MARVRLIARAALASAVTLAAAGATAAANPVAMVKPPADWRSDPEQAAAIAKSVAAAKPFGDPDATVASEVYVPAHGGKLSLVVSRATSRAGKLDRAGAVGSAVGDFHAMVARAKLSGGQPVEDAWQAARVVGTQVEASLAWRDGAAGTRDEARLVVAADAAALVAVSGECLSGSNAEAAASDACKAALATLDTGIAVGDRVAIAAASPAPTAPTAPDSPPPPRMTDGSRISLPPMVIPQDAQPAGGDRRPIIVGLGIAILGFAFYMNRRHRAKLEAEAGGSDDRDRDH